MRAILLFASVILIVPRVDAQRTNPIPVIGWDSLASLVQFTEIFKRAGIEGAFRSQLTIDSAGVIERIRTTPLNSEHSNNKIDSAFVFRIEQSIRSTPWLPGTEKGVRTRMSISIPFLFYLNLRNPTKVVIINADAVEVVRMH